MSLLMDALAHKLKALPPTIRANDASWKLPPAHSARPAATAIHATQSLTPGTESNRAAVRKVFVAQESKPASGKRHRLMISALVVTVIGIATYTGYQNHDSLSAANSPQRTASESLPARSSPVPTSPTGRESAPAVPIFAPNSPSTARYAESPEHPDKLTQSTDKKPNRGHDQVEPSPIRLIRSQPESDVNLQRAYTNLQGNALDLARHDYEQVTRTDPNHVDALLGLAAIAERQGRNSDAEHYRQRALIADPLDPGAQAAALSNQDSANQASIESRLKALLSAQPDSAQLSFALGNVFAKQARWSEAQQVYFNALASDNGNPDYLFNLAVSLDQMHQPKLAAQHYRMALAAAEHRPAAFNHEQANKRLSQLPP